MKIEEDTIKRCPFCGGMAMWIWEPYDCQCCGSGGDYVECQGKCMVKMYGRTAEEAIDLWNERRMTNEV